jgi:DNA-binding SARP family transcriptional activator
MSDVQFAILGPLEVRRDGQVLDLGGPKQRAVLAFLLTHRREPVSLDRMIDQLWGEDAPPKATASLQAYVSNLRRALEPDRAPRAAARILVSRPPGYALDVETGALDAMRFEEAADEARRALAAGDAAAALAHAE